MSFKKEAGEKIAIRRAHILTEQETKDVADFLQGAVYCWCNTHPKEYFHAKDLLGGLNTNWEDTPAQIIYSKYRAAGEDHKSAHELSGRAAGMILKSVLNKDKREFEIKRGYTLSYKWTGKTNN